MHVFITNRGGMSAGLEVVPETQTEEAFLLNLDKDNLRAQWNRNGENVTLEMVVPCHADDVEAPRPSSGGEQGKSGALHVRSTSRRDRAGVKMEKG